MGVNLVQGMQKLGVKNKPQIKRQHIVEYIPSMKTDKFLIFFLKSFFAYSSETECHISI